MVGLHINDKPDIYPIEMKIHPNYQLDEMIKNGSYKAIKNMFPILYLYSTSTPEQYRAIAAAADALSKRHNLEKASQNEDSAIDAASDNLPQADLIGIAADLPTEATLYSTISVALLETAAMEIISELPYEVESAIAVSELAPEVAPVAFASEFPTEETPAVFASELPMEETPAVLVSELPQEETPAVLVSEVPQEETPVVLAPELPQEETPVVLAPELPQEETPVVLAPELPTEETPAVLAPELPQEETPAVLAPELPQEETPAVLAPELPQEETPAVLAPELPQEESPAVLAPEVPQGETPVNSAPELPTEETSAVFVLELPFEETSVDVVPEILPAAEPVNILSERLMAAEPSGTTPETQPGGAAINVNMIIVEAENHGQQGPIENDSANPPPYINFIVFNRLGLSIKNLTNLLDSDEDFELNIIDCNSKDNSWDYVQSLTDSRIKSKIHFDKNLGPIYAVNFALSRRKPNQFFITIDSDTFIKTKNWIARFMEIFDAFPQVGLLGVMRDNPYPRYLPQITPMVKGSASYLELKNADINTQMDFIPGQLQCLSPKLIDKIGYWSEENGFGDAELSPRIVHYTDFKVGFVTTIEIDMTQKVKCGECMAKNFCMLNRSINDCFSFSKKYNKNESFVEKNTWKFKQTFEELNAGTRTAYCASVHDPESIKNHVYNSEWANENFYHYLINSN